MSLPGTQRLGREQVAERLERVTSAAVAAWSLQAVRSARTSRSSALSLTNATGPIAPRPLRPTTSADEPCEAERADAVASPARARAQRLAAHPGASSCWATMCGVTLRAADAEVVHLDLADRRARREDQLDRALESALDVDAGSCRNGRATRCPRASRPTAPRRGRAGREAPSGTRAGPPAWRAQAELEHRAAVLRPRRRQSVGPQARERSTRRRSRAGRPAGRRGRPGRRRRRARPHAGRGAHRLPGERRGREGRSGGGTGEPRARSGRSGGRPRPSRTCDAPDRDGDDRRAERVPCTGIDVVDERAPAVLARRELEAGAKLGDRTAPVAANHAESLRPDPFEGLFVEVDLTTEQP